MTKNVTEIPMAAFLAKVCAYTHSGVQDGGRDEKGMVLKGKVVLCPKHFEKRCYMKQKKMEHIAIGSTPNQAK